MEITHQTETAAFDKLRAKMGRIHPSNLAHPDRKILVNMTIGDLKSLMNFYRRNC